MFSRKSKNKEQDPFIRKVDFSDRIARRAISLGGYGIILIIVLIMVFLIVQSSPLFLGANIKKLFSDEIKHPEQHIFLIGTDEYQETAYSLNESGIFKYYKNTGEDGSGISLIGTDTLSLAQDERIVTADKGTLQEEYFAVGTDKGRIFSGEIQFKISYEGQQREITPQLYEHHHFQIMNSDSVTPAIPHHLTFQRTEENNKLYAWIDHQNKLHLQSMDENHNARFSDVVFDGERNNPFSALAFNEYGELLLCGSENGSLFWFDLSDIDNIQLRDRWRAADAEIGAMSFLIGDEALVVGSNDGSVSLWFRIRTPDNIFKYKRIRNFKSHPNKIVRIYPSPRNRNFLTIDQNSEIHLNFSTTGKTQYKFVAGDNAIQTAEIAPKSDGILLVDTQNRLGWYRLKNPHPEVTFQTLFGKVWYETYPEPAFVWQSTGGTDEFESKFSLIPVIFGTIKGTIYAMFFSVPLAILAAIYVSQFAPVRLARAVKPTVELLAALPSVVIGFLAGLYFSPLFEDHLMVILLFFFTTPAIVVLGTMSLNLIPEKIRIWAPNGWEVIYMILVLIIGFWILIEIAPSIEMVFFNGNIKEWFYAALNITYDTRNSLVVGFALGFAVIPIIFTVAEDALSNVPKSLITASMALGASRWQTVRRVVFPAASGGIFAGTMLGFGRAIGETMIVLMATGNTPILDMSPFNGFRAMSANIAVELPEAPVGGTLYRVLFLTALLLFIFTFIINTISAIIGDKLRQKYARF